MARRSAKMRSFFCSNQPSSGVDFCLPLFGGSLSQPARLGQGGEDTFGYPSTTFADRDARSALHVMHAVSGIVSDEAIQFTLPKDFIHCPVGARTSFVFGSRSNEATSWLLECLGDSSFIRFEFGDRWTIVGTDGKKFSILDPSKLDPESYAALTDYGVVARLSIPGQNGAVFLIAGLGGRATEGCGMFLSRNWEHLQSQFGDHDFAVILAFPPPVSPEQCTRIAQYPYALASTTAPVVQ